MNELLIRNESESQGGSLTDRVEELLKGDGEKCMLHQLLTHSCAVCVLFMYVYENVDGWMGKQADG